MRITIAESEKERVSEKGKRSYLPRNAQDENTFCVSCFGTSVAQINRCNYHLCNPIASLVPFALSSHDRPLWQNESPIFCTC